MMAANASASAPSLPACEVYADRDIGATRVLLWHLGKAGAGSKFTYELASALKGVSGFVPALCSARGSDLERYAAFMVGTKTCAVRTFYGDKRLWLGRLLAIAGALTMPKLAFDFRRFVKDVRPDVALCAFQSIWDLAALPSLVDPRMRFVLVLHDANAHPGDAYPLRTAAVRQQVAAADALLVLSDHVKQGAARTYGFPIDRIWCIPHGCFSFGAPVHEARSFPVNRPVRLLFLGRIVAYKGLEMLLTAYGLLRRRGVNVELEIAGDGDMDAYAAALENLPNVLVTNRWLSDDDICTALQRADLLILPYLEASQSGVAAAAMTAALPIVATPVGGLAEQVEHGVTGVISADVSADALVDAIASFVTSPTVYESCSAAALLHARETMDWGRIAGRVGAILTEVAERPRKRRLS